MFIRQNPLSDSVVVFTNFFEQVENLEPHCPGCRSVVRFGVTTEYRDKVKTHACITCGHTF